jgi:hypothetical protein
MNVLQQDALAKSLGMSSDEMSDMLDGPRNDGSNKRISISSLGKEDLAKRMEARDVTQTNGRRSNEIKSSVC